MEWYWNAGNTTELMILGPAFMYIPCTIWFIHIGLWQFNSFAIKEWCIFGVQPPGTLQIISVGHFWMFLGRKISPFCCQIGNMNILFPCPIPTSWSTLPQKHFAGLSLTLFPHAFLTTICEKFNRLKRKEFTTKGLDLCSFVMEGTGTNVLAGWVRCLVPVQALSGGGVSAHWRVSHSAWSVA